MLQYCCYGGVLLYLSCGRARGGHARYASPGLLFLGLERILALLLLGGSGTGRDILDFWSVERTINQCLLLRLVSFAQFEFLGALCDKQRSSKRSEIKDANRGVCVTGINNALEPSSHPYFGVRVCQQESNLAPKGSFRLRLHVGLSIC